MKQNKNRIANKGDNSSFKQPSNNITEKVKEGKFNNVNTVKKISLSRNLNERKIIRF